MTLIGREAELAELEAFLNGGQSALAVLGEPGAGKSALLGEVAEDALWATGAEPESGLAFAALHQLLRPVAHLADALPEAQRDAIKGALGLAESRTEDRFLVSAAVLSLLIEAAEPDGLLCVVDDFQWLDQASADALLFAARRLRGEKVRLLIAARDTTDVRHALRGVRQLRLTGLDEADAARLLTAAPAVIAEITRLTSGNPLALHEVGDLLTPDQLEGSAPLPDPLPIKNVFGDQIARLDEATKHVLLIAALEGQGDLGVVLRAGAEPTALHEAERTGLITTDGAKIRFRHPLVRSAVVTEAGAAQKRQVHNALADAVGDADRKAQHRAEAALGPDEDVAQALTESARRARERGGYADAATALARAADLTPATEAKARRLAVAAESAWLGGKPGQARSLLTRARALNNTPELEQLRGRFELNSGDAAEAMRIFLDAAGDRIELLADAAEAASYVGDTAVTIEVGRRAEPLPPSFLRSMLVGTAALRAGDTAKGTEILRTAEPREDASELLWAAAAASHLGEGDAASDFAARAGRVARVSGMVGTLPVVLEFAATAERMNGNLAHSAALSEEGLALAKEAGYVNCTASHLANLAVVAAIQGREDDCRRFADEALMIAIPHRIELRVGVANYALALLDLGQGRFQEAHDRLTAMTTGHPVTVWGSTADRVEAAVASGNLDAARKSVEFLKQWSVNATTTRAKALVARCRALVEDDAVPLYEQALTTDSEYDRARTALLLGERLRRDRKVSEARPHLRTAAEIFGRLGARPWEQRALGELRAAGEARQRTEAAELTPQELRIAQLVAEGVSNKDVAARLFLSPRTVEYHLYKIYPKLGVSSRTELARVLGQ
ncbi:helix-turn-helix transcriptional regulator [Allokutzneria albata]|uniref:AAA ATPase domain-containing protein n=1 Tax=Allokutzneria albata TaxID=211114 RepID=A0A1G9UKL9_ALLAB|nr:LuxR family transcriptional regulator [Allokutzneria albata]SDM60438.1 AAA ATPase domain-containing protein [Allokutzneria albata]